MVPEVRGHDRPAAREGGVMGQQFSLIDAEALARLERKIDSLTAAMAAATVIPAPEWCICGDLLRGHAATLPMSPSFDAPPESG